MLDCFNEYRGLDGYINLNKIEKNNIEGTFWIGKYKYWFEYRGKKYLFKEDFFDNHGLREVINEEMFKQLSLRNAKYDLAILDGKRGAITESFLEDDINYMRGTIFILKYGFEIDNCNTLENYLACLADKKFKGQPKHFVIDELLKWHIIDMLVSQYDRNIKNIGFFILPDKVITSPRFDSQASFLPKFTRVNMEEFIASNDKASYIRNNIELSYTGIRTKFTISSRIIRDSAMEEYWASQISSKVPLFIRERMGLMDPFITQAAGIDFTEIWKYIEFYGVKEPEIVKAFYQSLYDHNINEFERVKEKIL